jgi:DNA-directed RNA polymerase specialized sigma24 family protein
MSTTTQAEERDYPILYLRHGIPEAFKVFFFEYYSELFSFAQMLLQRRGIARKVTMDAFFLLWDRRTDFDSAKKIKAFLYLAVRNKCIQQLRAPVNGTGETPAVEAVAGRAPVNGTGETPAVEAVAASLPPELLRELFAFAATAV